VLEGRPRASNHRASFAVLLGLAGDLAIPAAIALAQQSPTIELIDASWAIPIAAGLGFIGVGASNLARTRIQRTLGRAAGEGRARLARILATLAILIAVTASISVGVYELLLRLEK
jgi:hypothetical protein